MTQASTNPDSTPPRLWVAVLGPLQLRIDGRPLSPQRNLRETALLTYLAVEAEQAHARTTLAGLLWPDSDPEPARNNLRQTLSALRQTLHERGSASGAAPLLLVDRQTVQFNRVSAAWVDVIAFSAALAFPSTHTHADPHHCPVCMARLAEAVALYRGPLLHDFSLPTSDLFAEWQLLKREQLQRQLVGALQQLCNYHLAQGEYVQACHYARRRVKIDPFDETGQQHLLRALALSGQAAAALAHFATYQAQLQQELGVPPGADLQALVEQIRTGAFDREIDRQHALGATAKRGNKEKEASDEHAIQKPKAKSQKRQDWGSAPQVSLFVGRAAEMATLAGWLREGIKLVAVLGLGGIGKSTLVTQVARTQAEQFEVVIWRSLLNAPPLSAVLSTWLQHLSQHQVATLPDSADEQLNLFFHYLRQQRSLLVLDNLESILQEGKAGRYRPGYEGYGQLLDRMAHDQHQGTLLLTSREQPHGLNRLADETPAVRLLPLDGLQHTASQQLLAQHGLYSSDEGIEILVQRYSGNPLALKLVAHTIHELFADDLTSFLAEETPLFADIRDVLDQQFERLNQLERSLLLWLAIAREPMRAAEVRAALVPTVSSSHFLEALHGLQRRSLLEQNEAGFTLQNVVTEYLTTYVIDKVYEEILQERPSLLNSHALLLAQAYEYVRQGQARVLLEPLAHRLLARIGRTGLEQRCRRLLDHLRSSFPLAPGYAAGNLLNLLRQVGSDLRGYNFSRLSVWQADLRRANLAEVDFTHADLRGSTFTETLEVVYTLKFSPDGHHLAVGTASTIRLWQVNDWQPVLVWHAHTDYVWSIAYHPAGMLLASGGAGPTVRVWNAQCGQLVRALPVHRTDVRAVAFSADGALLAAAGSDAEIRLWDVQTWQLIGTLCGHTGLITALAFSARGHLASASRDGTVRLWDVQRRKTLHACTGHTAWVDCVAFSPDGTLLASGGWDRLIRLWAVDEGEYQATLHGHTDAVKSLAFSPNGDLLASSSLDTTVRLWRLHTRQQAPDDGWEGSCQLIATRAEHGVSVDALDFRPNGDLLASGAVDGSLALWNMCGYDRGSTQSLNGDGHLLSMARGQAQWTACLAISPDGELLACGCPDQTVRVWDFAAQKVIHTLTGAFRWVRSVAFSPDGRLLASSSGDRLVHVWKTQGWQKVFTLRGHERAVQSVAFSPDGRWLASGSWDNTVRLWDLQQGTPHQILAGHTALVQAVAFSPDGHLLASASYDRTVRIWEVPSGQLRLVLHGHTGHVEALAFQPNHKSYLLVSGADDHTVRLWDVASGEALQVLHGHTQGITRVAFSTDGTLLASASWDQTIRVWEVDGGELVHVLRGHTQTVRAVAFHPSQPILVSSSSDEKLCLWGPRTGTCLHTLRAPGPYQGMKITGATGISAAQRAALQALGAV